jgi:predicted TIM-barrel fold metal-dependent hydrolase
VPHPRFPAIDFHNHLGDVFGGGWADRTPGELTDVLDQAGVEIIVDLDGGQGDHLSRELEKWRGASLDRVLVFAGLDYPSWAVHEQFGDMEAERLRDSARRGARGLKVWKPLGLLATDPSGRLVSVDDARLDPLWRTAAELGIPILIHVGDPYAFFEPADVTNERWEELTDHPDWHFWPTRRADTGEAEGYPPLREILDALIRLVARWQDTIFIGAHVASSAEDLSLARRFLDASPNAYVDIAERISELGRQPYSARAFLVERADRVVFGVDRPASSEIYALYYRFLETYDESFDYGIESVPRQGRWQIHGLGLPDVALRKIYRENARRILRVPG